MLYMTEPPVPLNRKLGGLQYGCLVVGKISYPCWKLNHCASVVQPVAWSLHRLHCPGSFCVVTYLPKCADFVKAIDYSA